MGVIKVSDLITVKDRFNKCGIEATQFEKEFVNSLLKNAKYLSKNSTKKIFGNIEDLYNREIELNLSDRQKKVFEKIDLRFRNAYNDRCAYYIYKQVISDYEIKLEDFDKETLLSFKGQKEDEESKEWLRQIIQYR